MLENEPNTGEKSDDQHGTGQHSVDQHSADQHGAGQHGAEPAAGLDASAGTTSAAPGSAADDQPAAVKPAVKTVRTRRSRAATRPAGPPVEDVPPPATIAGPSAAEASTAAEPSAEASSPAEPSAKASGRAQSSAKASGRAPRSAKASGRAEPAVKASSPTEPPAKASRPAGPPAQASSPAEPSAQASSPAEPSAKASRPAGPPAQAFSAPEQPAQAFSPTGPPAHAFSAPEPPSRAYSAAEAPAQAGFSAPEAPVPVTQPAFQAPRLIFQPPQAVPAAATPSRSGSDDPEPVVADDDEPGQDGDDAGRSRRRRGGRGRSKKAGDEAGQEPGEATASDGGSRTAADAQGAETGQDTRTDGDGEAEAGDESAEASARRRRRRRKRSGSADGDQPAPDDPPETVVHVREPRAPSSRSAKARDEVQGLKGSTRLEAKKQRRREGRDSGRRRPPVITESEFLARREAVDRTMVVRQRGEHTQIAVLEDDILVEHYVDRTSHQSFVGNVYLGKVQNVLPSMEAAFVDIGKGRNAVLYAGEVNFDASGLEGQTRRIESALKSGQSVLVQVTKDPVGHKGARLTSQVSLPGRYLVYVPGASMTGISRKLPDTERGRLKQILKQVMPEGAGVIVRTAAEGATEEELAHDVARLSAQWENIERKSKTASPPELLYSEPDLTIRVVRDIFNEDFSRLIVAGDDGWDTVNEYVRYVAPHLIDRLTRWQDERDVFAQYRIDEQLAKALDRKVWLPSGGSLVIDKTEAMTVIDVNTGKFTGQGGNLEETVTRNNLEAAEEIVRQLRLRDIGGILVIDFIDMVLESNRDLVLRRLLECLARDRTKHQVAEVTSLGLVQMTRKRVGSGLLEAFSVTCECCNGRGVHVSLEPTEPGAPAGQRQRGDERGGQDGAKTSTDTGEDKPAAGSRRRRRKTPAPAPAGNGSAAAAAAAIASASADGAAAPAGSGAAGPNGHADAAHGQESPASSGLAAEG
jgi:ribonuclease E